MALSGEPFKTSQVQQIEEAFRRFDADGSGALDKAECRHMCSYLGWGEEEVHELDLNGDGKVSLQEFRAFIGHMGGMAQLFEQRRLRISSSRKDVCDYHGIVVGARVRAHYYVRGHKSRSWKEALVLEVGHVGHYGKAEGAGPGTLGVLLEYGFGQAAKGRQWRTRQVVPPSWVLSSIEDESVATALRECGIVDQEQAFWSLLLPDSELHAVERLETCQRKALSLVRAISSDSHERALPGLRERFVKLGWGERELHSVFSWIQDLAPVVIHVGLDRVGHFLEVDEFYRNQFETKTSCGALDSGNRIRKGWEAELFGNSYDEASPFARCKYGALNVMNDYRGVVSALQYGDSYLVLKDVRLRCTFASTDSGGIKGSRLAVLDKYAHVLAEYSDQELRGLVDVAEAAIEQTPGVVGAQAPQLLRGTTEDPTLDWVTVGFPSAAQSSGAFFFEVELLEHCCAPQVGLLSEAFERLVGRTSTQGVGDDASGWGVGQNATRWHAGPQPWGQVWKSGQVPPQARRGRPAAPDTGLSERVVVGVLADLDAGRLWFASDGAWDEEPTFALPPDPSGARQLYPAASLKGRASFNFGPHFAHPPQGLAAGPEGLASAARWPGMVEGKVRIDAPRLGNEETLSIYKEAQIHGEVSLKRNVQRLVACRKYLDMPKAQRSYALQVKCAGVHGGTFERAGVHNEAALYASASGAAIHYDPPTDQWRLSKSLDSLSEVCFWVPADPPGAPGQPPQKGWQLPDEAYGVIPASPLRDALRHGGMSEAAVADLLAPFLAQEGQGEVVFHRRGDADLQAAWGKLAEPPGELEALWADATDRLKASLIVGAGLSAAAVVLETSHPFQEKPHSWTRSICMEGEAGLAVHFSERCSTPDSSSKFCVRVGGLFREAAGCGARLELSIYPNTAWLSGKVRGTVAERGDGGLWKVRLDRRPPPPGDAAAAAVDESAWPAVGDEVDALYSSGSWYPAKIAEVGPDGTYVVDWCDGDAREKEKPREKLRKRVKTGPVSWDLEDIPRHASSIPEGQECFAFCREFPNKVNALYKAEDATTSHSADQCFVATVGHEIAAFSLDRSCPLQPFTLGRFAGGGPAGEAGVMEGWYLDLPETIRGCAEVGQIFRDIGGVERAYPEAVKEIVAACFADLDEALRRLNAAVRALMDARLVFTDSCVPRQPALLPEARVAVGADARLGDEVAQLGVTGDGRVVVERFARKGRVHEAGVRTGWVLDVARCQGLASADAEDLRKDPMQLLAASGATLAFECLDPSKVLKFTGSGEQGGGRWGGMEVLGERAEFEWSTGGYMPDSDSDEDEDYDSDCDSDEDEGEDSDSGGSGGQDAQRCWGVLALVLPTQPGRREEQEREVIVLAFIRGVY